MKQFIILAFIAITAHSSSAQDTDTDTTFWKFAKDFEVDEKGTLKQDWGREVVTYLGTINWRSAGGKTLQIRILTSYRQITQANGFNDQSLIALVKTNHQLIKAYDMVSRQNLPVRIENNELVYKANKAEITSALPAKFSARFCVKDLNCFTEINP
ncbi:MAG: hypothetical protein WDZ35_10450 [Crocinitomicaceae bacterium]